MGNRGGGRKGEAGPRSSRQDDSWAGDGETDLIRQNMNKMNAGSASLTPHQVGMTTLKFSIKLAEFNG